MYICVCIYLIDAYKDVRGDEDPERYADWRHSSRQNEREAKQPELQAAHDVSRHGGRHRRRKYALAPASNNTGRGGWNCGVGFTRYIYMYIYTYIYIGSTLGTEDENMRSHLQAMSRP